MVSCSFCLLVAGILGMALLLSVVVVTLVAALVVALVVVGGGVPITTDLVKHTCRYDTILPFYEARVSAPQNPAFSWRTRAVTTECCYFMKHACHYKEIVLSYDAHMPLRQNPAPL